MIRVSFKVFTTKEMFSAFQKVSPSPSSSLSFPFSPSTSIPSSSSSLSSNRINTRKTSARVSVSLDCTIYSKSRAHRDAAVRTTLPDRVIDAGTCMGPDMASRIRWSPILRVVLLFVAPVVVSASTVTTFSDG